MVSDSEERDTRFEVSDEQSTSCGSAGLSDAGVAAMQGAPEREVSQAEAVNTSTPIRFGTFAHEAYSLAAYENFDDVDREVPVIVTKRDGAEAQGRIDTMIGDTLIDYKTNDMRDWDVAKAVSSAKEHGLQMQEYVESPGTSKDARGWIVATVPPRSEEVRQTYANTLARYGVGVKFTGGEDQDTVMEAVKAAVGDTKSG
jgi:hypothetical protein